MFNFIWLSELATPIYRKQSQTGSIGWDAILPWQHHLKGRFIILASNCCTPRCGRDPGGRWRRWADVCWTTWWFLSSCWRQKARSLPADHTWCSTWRCWRPSPGSCGRSEPCPGCTRGWSLRPGRSVSEGEETEVKAVCCFFQSPYTLPFNTKFSFRTNSCVIIFTSNTIMVNSSHSSG